MTTTSAPRRTIQIRRTFDNDEYEVWAVDIPGNYDAEEWLVNDEHGLHRYLLASGDRLTPEVTGGRGPALSLVPAGEEVEVPPLTVSSEQTKHCNACSEEVCGHPVDTRQLVTVESPDATVHVYRHLRRDGSFATVIDIDSADPEADVRVRVDDAEVWG